MDDEPFECTRCGSLAVVPIDLTCASHPWHGRCQVCDVVVVDSPVRTRVGSGAGRAT